MSTSATTDLAISGISPATTSSGITSAGANLACLEMRTTSAEVPPFAFGTFFFILEIIESAVSS